jgi:hypothetical protein
MTLQELIGELITLAQAYPDTTPVVVRHSRFSEQVAQVSTVTVESSSEVQIILDGV